MAEDIKNTEMEQQKVESDNYIEAIKEMKENTVSKKQYDELKEQNKQLLNAYINGEKPTQIEDKKNVDVDELRDTIFNKDCTNLEYMTNVLQLRNELIRQGEKDPFLPYGKNILPTDEDITKAKKVANVISECIEIAEGDSDIFTTELQKRLVDPVLPRRK